MLQVSNRLLSFWCQCQFFLPSCVTIAYPERYSLGINLNSNLNRWQLYAPQDTHDDVWWAFTEYDKRHFITQIPSMLTACFCSILLNWIGALLRAMKNMTFKDSILLFLKCVQHRLLWGCTCLLELRLTETLHKS